MLRKKKYNVDAETLQKCAVQRIRDFQARNGKAEVPGGSGGKENIGNSGGKALEEKENGEVSAEDKLEVQKYEARMRALHMRRLRAESTARVAKWNSVKDEIERKDVEKFESALEERRRNKYINDLKHMPAAHCTPTRDTERTPEPVAGVGLEHHEQVPTPLSSHPAVGVVESGAQMQAQHGYHKQALFQPELERDTAPRPHGLMDVQGPAGQSFGETGVVEADAHGGRFYYLEDREYEATPLPATGLDYQALHAAHAFERSHTADDIGGTQGPVDSVSRLFGERGEESGEERGMNRSEQTSIPSLPLLGSRQQHTSPISQREERRRRTPRVVDHSPIRAPGSSNETPVAEARKTRKKRRPKAAQRWKARPCIPVAPYVPLPAKTNLFDADRPAVTPPQSHPSQRAGSARGGKLEGYSGDRRGRTYLKQRRHGQVGAEQTGGGRGTRRHCELGGYGDQNAHVDVPTEREHIPMPASVPVPALAQAPATPPVKSKLPRLRPRGGGARV